MGRHVHSVIHHWATKHKAISELAKPELVPKYVELDEGTRQYFQAKKDKKSEALLNEQKLKLAEEVKKLKPRRVLVRRALDESIEPEKVIRKECCPEKKKTHLKRTFPCPECGQAFPNNLSTIRVGF